LVVVDHGILTLGHQRFPQLLPFEAVSGSVGRLGVNIFFVISGFIMVYSTRRDWAMPPAERVKDFALKRLIRLVPLYYIAIAATVAVSALNGSYYNPWHILTSLLFLPNLADPASTYMAPVVGVGWTLNCEAFFYVAFCASLLLSRRIAPFACIAAIAVTVVLSGFLARHTTIEPWRSFFQFYAFKNMFLFCLGVMFGIAYQYIPKQLGKYGTIASIALIALNISVASLSYLEISSASWQVFSGVTVAAVVLFALMDETRTGLAGNKALLLMGNASYSIYLFHVLAIGGVIVLCDKAIASALPMIVLTSVIGTAVGLIVHLRVEAPIIRLLKEGRRAPATGTTAPTKSHH